MATRDKFVSLFHPIAVDAGLGRLARCSDYAEHVEQMMRQVLLTAPGERINRPDFGCGLRRMVFAPNSDVSANLVKVTVLQALDRWLSNVVDVDKVDVSAESEKLVVGIQYVLKVKRERRYLNVEVAL